MNKYKSILLVLVSIALAACAPATPRPGSVAAVNATGFAEATVEAAWTPTPTPNQTGTAAVYAATSTAFFGARATEVAAWTPTPVRLAPEPGGHLEIGSETYVSESRGGNFYHLSAYYDVLDSWYGVSWWTPMSNWVLWTPLRPQVEAPPMLAWEKQEVSYAIKLSGVEGTVEFGGTPYVLLKGQQNTLLIDFEVRHVLVLRQNGTFWFEQLGLGFVDGEDVFSVHMLPNFVRITRR